MNDLSTIRLNNLIKADKKDNPEKLIKLVKSEIVFVLKNYMDIKYDDVKLDIGIDNNGKYLINFSGEVSRIFLVKTLMWKIIMGFDF